MTSTILIIIVSLLSITISNALYPSTTTNCNYAVDIWWDTVSPPSQSPTPEPTDQPTKSPTPEPTEVNQTMINTEYIDDGEVARKPGSDSGSAFILLLLHPYAINECYSFNFTSEPFNEVAWKYTCKDTSTLKREIWFDSLECTGVASDTTEISETQRGMSTQFICSASTNCAYADISIVPAITQSPTSEPTEEPTPTTTPYPTISGQTNFTIDGNCAGVRDFLGYCDQLMIANETICQCDSACEGRNPRDCCDDYEDVCYEDVLVAKSGGNDHDFEGCNNDNGPQPGADPVFVWKYATNICVNMLDFYEIFFEGGNPENFNGTVYNIGWQCINNNYYMALFNGSDCSQNDNPAKYIDYSNNKCAFDGGMWATVSCSEDYQTPPPTPPPTIKPPTNAPTTTEGCRQDCTDTQVCVVTTRECEDLIVVTNCQSNAQCDGDNYKCKRGEFCYFSECTADGDCNGDADLYECEDFDGDIDGVEYEYGVCKEVEVGGNDTGGVKRNGIVIVVAMVVGLVVLV